MGIRRALALLLLAGAGCSTGVKKAAPTSSRPPEAVKILQFYAREPVMARGESTVLCYGVENAKTVRIDPPIEGLAPALTRCVEVRPVRDTQYTFYAKGEDGKEIVESATVRVVNAPVARGGRDVGPKIISFQSESCTKDYSGKPVFLLSFGTANADEISIEPAVFPALHGSPSGKFYVTPTGKMTYTLIASGKHGPAARKPLTVDAAECK